ncbi:zinc finger protein 624-like [Actinia tenebrosa]|uniref:Zinc finger protein 624-like n=1 Tax=Actinia tenebrosa TaxID=6105 RepID=A0A6P8HDA7_ACTTE|nr:zinc finger protein 624-like [Actinia tenebrosa]XP_031554374.1 zinc finger protein 624-like [Actinia tenebrosa]XP_031554375.1 zinc finger protein 624-like [Actinia tenebrosa]XP_031554376.1 zinc finger protein 624-like [Actinia tenebrosa]XP_031554377.1 zinc finger protein 624-like [Actinia tenebrosa]
MDSDCASRTRCFDEGDERRELIVGSDIHGNYIDYYQSHNTREKDSTLNPYRTNLSPKQVIIKRGRPRKYWPEYREPIQSTYHSTHDDQLPSLALATRPGNDHRQDLRENTLIQGNDYSSRSKTAAEQHEIARHLEPIEGSRKHASRLVDMPLSEPRHSLGYPTQEKIGSAFTPARGRCYRSCCQGNLQKYSEPYFLPCYPLVIQEQVTSPHLERDICYPTAQLPNYSFETQNEITAQRSSPKNPIIIDCFSLAIDGNNEKIPGAGVNQETSVSRYHWYNEEDRLHKDTIDPPRVIKVNQNKFQHDCMICQQIATGEVHPRLCTTSVIGDKCCYQTSQANSHCTACLTGNTKDESSESYWDNTARDTINSEDVHRKKSPDQGKMPRSPIYTGFKQEESDSQEANIVMKDDTRTVVNSAFSNPNEKKSKSNAYESNLKVLRRQEPRVNAAAELLDADTQESSPGDSGEASCHPQSHSYYTSTNTTPPDNLAADTKNSLERNWEAMYDIIEEPDKTSKKSYFCSHCGRAFTHLSSLNNHIRTHTGQKPFRCRYCSKRFAQSGVLTAHLRTHTGEKPFNCVLCGKRFAQTTTLANHVRTHTGQKPFSCRFCKRTFAQSSTRNKHELSHTKEKPFECKYCGRSFTQSATVMRHMRIHMRDNKYSCVHCGKTFAYLYSLDKHLDEHT